MPRIVLRPALLMLALLASGAQAAVDICPAAPPAPPGLAPPMPIEDQRLHLNANNTETLADGSTRLEGRARGPSAPTASSTTTPRARCGPPATSSTAIRA